MRNTRKNQLPALKILLGSIVIPWFYRAKFSRKLALPTLIFVATWAMSILFWKQIQAISPWLIMLFYLPAFSIFAVSCHRLILADEQSGVFSVSLDKKVLIFSVWLIVMFFIFWPVMTVALNVILAIPLLTHPDRVKNLIEYAILLASIPAMYVMARLSLVFPATAIDKGIRLKQSWEITRDNGWRLTLIVFLYPWLINLVVWFLLRDNATILEKVLVLILYYIGLAIGIFALSLSYQHFMENPASPAEGVNSEENASTVEGGQSEGQGSKSRNRNQIRIGFAIVLVFIIYTVSRNFFKFHADSTTSVSSIPIRDQHLKKIIECGMRLHYTKPDINDLDIGSAFNKHNRPAAWESQEMDLGNTCFKAVVGPYIYQDENNQDPDYYSIEVEAMQPTRKDANSDVYSLEESWLVYFKKDFKIQDLPENFAQKNIAEFVSYDKKARLVTFAIGNKQLVYRLPTP